MAEENEVEDISKLDLNVKKLKGNIFNGILTPFRYKVTLIRSLIIGVILGTIPAAGVSIANFLAYAEAKRSSKDPDSFGHGNPEGIVAPESANNAVVSSSLIPALTIGVPGTASAAIIMSALIMQGLRPGPNLFEENGAIAYAFFIGLIIINIIMLIMGWAGSFIFAKISDLPKNILVPIIIILSCVGSFSMQYRIEDVIVTVIFGFFGYVMRKFNYPPVAIVLALILGSMVEKGFLRALMLSGGNYATFFIRPISVVIILLTVATLFFSSRGWTLSKK